MQVINACMNIDYILNYFIENISLGYRAYCPIIRLLQGLVYHLHQVNFLVSSHPPTHEVLKVNVAIPPSLAGRKLITQRAEQQQQSLPLLTVLSLT